MEREKLRSNFLSLLKQEDIGLLKAAKEIGVTYQTFLNFVHNKRQINIRTAWKIEDWISKKVSSKNLKSHDL